MAQAARAAGAKHVVMVSSALVTTKNRCTKSSLPQRFQCPEGRQGDSRVEIAHAEMDYIQTWKHLHVPSVIHPLWSAYLRFQIAWTVQKPLVDVTYVREANVCWLMVAQAQPSANDAEQLPVGPDGLQAAGAPSVTSRIPPETYDHFEVTCDCLCI